MNIKVFDGFADHGEIVIKVEAEPFVDPGPELVRRLGFGQGTGFVSPAAIPVFEPVEERVVGPVFEVLFDIVCRVDQVDPFA